MLQEKHMKEKMNNEENIKIMHKLFIFHFHFMDNPIKQRDMGKQKNCKSFFIV